MPLTSGTRLGPYQVESVLGHGGMGEVYRARDTKLERDVALKILPTPFASDPDRLARFDREAKTLASLNHPHIAQIYGFEQSGVTSALVMELVEGDTLAELIARSAAPSGQSPRGSAASLSEAWPAAGTGPRGIPIDEAVAIARQIAAALEAAHEHGIIHRDLKPANIKVRPDGTVKVLDFGLAKVLDPSMSSADVAALGSPTLTSPALVTSQGVVLGTAAYMSPEQARGRPVDKRADIWAFGCVLFEAIAGRPAFAGETITDTLAAVVRAEPDWGALPTDLPPGLHRLLRRCLEKDARKRLRDIGDAVLELEDGTPARIGSATAASESRTPRWLKAAVALAAVFVAGAAGWVLNPGTAPEPRTLVRFALAFDAGVTLSSPARRSFALSPDGETLAYAANRQIFFRSVSGVESRPGPEPTSTSLGPFFSPDGEWLGFFDAGRLMKARTNGDSLQPVTVPTANTYGAAWTDRNTIVFSTLQDIMEVPDSGGTPQQLITAGADHVFMWPDALPGGEVLLLTRVDATSRREEIVAYRRRSREVRPVLAAGSAARYARSGHLIYYTDGNLFSVGFDAERLAVRGEPILIARGVGRVTGNSDTAPQFDISHTGLLAYAGAGAVAAADRSRLVWVDERGLTTTIADDQGAYSDPRLSPDGSRLALHLRDAEDDVWVREQTRGTLTRMSFEAGEDETPVWSPDGRLLAFAAARDSDRVILRIRADGSGEEETLWKAPAHAHVSDWSPDGSVLLVDVVDPKTGWDIWSLTLGGSVTAKPLLQTRFGERNGRISPDGAWLAYVSDQSGRPEIYLQRFPTLDERWQVSTGGGQQPVWSRDGKRLYYRSENAVMAVDVLKGASVVSAPRELFPDRFHSAQGLAHVSYDVARDGRLLMLLVGGETPAAGRTGMALNLIVNWMDAR